MNFKVNFLKIIDLLFSLQEKSNLNEFLSKFFKDN